MARGVVTRTDAEYVVNRYRSTTAAMTYGVVRFPVGDVKRVEEELDAEDVVRRRHRDLAPTDAVGRVGLAKYALAQKVRFEGERLLEEALALDPAVPEGAALYGGLEKFAAARRGNPALDTDLRAALAGYLALRDGPARAKEAASIAARFGMLPRAEYFERAWRSSREAKGFEPNVVARLRAEKHPGASYALRIPESYDPFTPAPLLIALHDGGAGGKDGKSVVGRGRDADALYAGEADRFGWIVACPTAVIAPWTDPANDAWLLDVLEEVTARFHVDLDRVFVAGHGAGAAGAWTFASKHPTLLAGLASSASTTAGVGLKALRDAKLRLFLYHATDDTVTGPTYARADADALLELGADVTYLELPAGGHSLPGDAEKEMFDLFGRPRRYDPRRTSAWPASSFARSASADEKRDLGDPAASWAGGR
jgi:dienelactone hydrolase